MLFEELQDRTEELCTYNEYKAIEAMYSVDENMSKDDAAAVWNFYYGKKHRQAAKERQKLEKEILEAAANRDTQDFPDHIWKIITNAERIFKKRKNEDPWFLSFVTDESWATDEHGLTWSLKKWGKTPNGCWTIYDLNLVQITKKGSVENFVQYRFY